jgi:hypothetical protein
MVDLLEMIEAPVLGKRNRSSISKSVIDYLLNIFVALLIQDFFLLRGYYSISSVYMGGNMFLLISSVEGILQEVACQPRFSLPQNNAPHQP